MQICVHVTWSEPQPVSTEAASARLSQVPRMEPKMGLKIHANFDTKSLNLQKLSLYSSPVFAVQFT